MKRYAPRMVHMGIPELKPDGYHRARTACGAKIFKETLLTLARPDTVTCQRCRETELYRALAVEAALKEPDEIFVLGHSGRFA